MRRMVRLQAVGVIAVASFGVLPAVEEVRQSLTANTSIGVAPWAYVVLWMGLVQWGYAIYLFQLPDFSSAWVTAHACLAVAVAYAIGWGAGMASGDEGRVIVLLGLAREHHAGQVTRWCLIMFSLSLLATYLLGRLSLRWKHRWEAESL